MNYVSIVCDIFQFLCWCLVLYCFNRLLKERAKLRHDNRLMFKMLTYIASKEVPEHSIFYNSNQYANYSSTIFELGNIIEEIQSEAREVIECMTEEVE